MFHRRCITWVQVLAELDESPVHKDGRSLVGAGLVAGEIRPAAPRVLAANCTIAKARPGERRQTGGHADRRLDKVRWIPTSFALTRGSRGYLRCGLDA